ncbi:response regulator transcription factor [bacterium]|nr:response regulator transcription factor [bacterium]
MEFKKILLLMTRSKLGDRIENAFKRANFSVTRTDNPDKVISILEEENPYVLVLNWDYTNGFIEEIIRVLRDSYRKTGLVLVSRSKKAEERIQALEQGADECYIQIPELDELVAKVRAIVRRIDLVDNSPKTLKIKDVEINLNTHEVRNNGKLIDLTYTQFKLLYLLASHRENVFTRSEILTKVWGENTYVTDRTVDVHVKRLREKLGEEKQPLKYIQTIHGLGYRFV